MADQSFVYDDKRLWEMYAQLSPAKRRTALKGAFRRCGNEVRKVALTNLRAAVHPQGDRRDFEKGVRLIMFKQSAGFRVACSYDPKTKEGAHTNRHGLRKPVLMWLEDGTAQRATKSRSGRTGHNTGRITRQGFLDAARRQCEPSVTEDIHRSVVEFVTKTARKYGCE